MKFFTPAVICYQPHTLKAAQQIGVAIPTLCHHPDLCVAGVCRVCVVEVEGQRALQAEPFEGTGPLRVRMAVHAGPAEERGNDFFGPTLLALLSSDCL